MTGVQAQIEGSFTDFRDGNAYKTITIGEQIWMSESLNYKSSKGSWCYGDNDNNCAKFGRLYDFETAQKVCPKGWHLPTKAEFETLLGYFGGAGNEAGLALKDGGSSGFNAQYGGKRYIDDTYFNQSFRGWSSTKFYDNSAWYLGIDSGYGMKAYMGNSPPKVGYSVRCLKD